MDKDRDGREASLERHNRGAEPKGKYPNGGWCRLGSPGLSKDPGAVRLLRCSLLVSGKGAAGRGIPVLLLGVHVFSPAANTRWHSLSDK